MEIQTYTYTRTYTYSAAVASPWLRARRSGPTQFRNCTVDSGNVTSCACNEPSFAPQETPTRFSCLPYCAGVRGAYDSVVCDRALPNSTCEPSCPPETSAPTSTCTADGEWDVLPVCRPSLCSVCFCARPRAECSPTVVVQPLIEPWLGIETLVFARSTLEPLFPFSAHPSLRKLVFYHCNVTTIPADTFAALGALTALDFERTTVQDVQPGAFRGLSALQSLTMEGINCTTLPRGVFDELTALVRLRLIRHTSTLFSLASLPAGVFQALTGLQELRLSGDAVFGAFLEQWNVSNWAPFGQSLLDLNVDQLALPSHALPEFVLRFANLRNLSAGVTSIDRVPLGTVDRLTRLERLVLTLNSVSIVQREAFAGMTALRDLDMRGNVANCILLPDGTVACACGADALTRAVNGSCLPWCPAISTADLHARLDPAMNGTACALPVHGDACQLTCDPGFCAGYGQTLVATCGMDGEWRSSLLCVPLDDCSAPTARPGTDRPPSATAAPSSAVLTTATSIPIVLVACLVVAVVVVRRRLRRGRTNLAIRAELRSVIAQCVQTAFQRDYGHAVHDLRDQSVSFQALEVPLSILRRDRVIGRGESGEVWLGSLARMKATVTAVAAESSRPAQPLTSARGPAGPVPVAVKLCDDVDAEAQVQVLLEAHVLHLLRHEHIVSLVAVVTTQLPVLVCTEYMSGGDLKMFLRACRPTNETVKVVLGSEDFDRMAAQVCSALAFLEEKRILHRDVAARNVLVNVDGSVVKLSDLGAARDVYRTEEYIKSNSSSARLPIAWMAPESLLDNVYTHKSDVWSFGVLLWELTSFARTPYGALGPREIAAEVAAGNRLGQPAACTTAMYTLMTTCWAPNATDRPLFADLARDLGRRGGLDCADGPPHGRASVPVTPSHARASTGQTALGGPSRRAGGREDGVEVHVVSVCSAPRHVGCSMVWVCQLQFGEQPLITVAWGCL